MKKRLLAMLLACAVVLSVAGCNQNNAGSGDTTTPAAGGNTTTPADGGDTTTPADTTAAPEETTVPENVLTGNADAENAFYVWMWNDDVKKILDGVLAEVDPELYGRIVYVNTGGSNWYQEKLDNILEDPSNALYPDVVALEADYILKYTNSDYILPIADLGITADDYSKQAQYTLDVATNGEGKLMALSWQAAPGSWAVRADLAEKYLGTTDPDEVQSYFATWDKVLETARKVNTDSAGETKLISGIDDVKRIFQGSRTNAWYNSDDTIVIDDNMTKYMELAKTLYTEELTWNTSQWGDDWNANKEGDKVLAWPSCTWFTYWCLSTNYAGQYIQIAGPQNFYWGGTWLAATAGCSDKDAAAKLIKYVTCDASFMAKINALNSDYVNNTEAVDMRIKECADAGVSTCPVLVEGQNFLELNKPLIAGIVVTMTAEDQTINGKFDVEVLEYCKGNKDYDTAIADFKKAVVDTYSYLKA